MTENPVTRQEQDQERLDAVQDRIDDAKDAAASLEDADVAGDLGGAPGTGGDQSV